MNFLSNPAFFIQLRAVQLASFVDLLRLVVKKPNLRVVDLGCGTGEFTRKLADSLLDSDVLGIDSSPEMIHEAQTFVRQGLRFEQTSFENIAVRDTKWDLIFSHAALQLVNNHGTFLTDLVKRIAPGGQLAVQMVAMDEYLDMSNVYHPFSGLPLTTMQTAALSLLAEIYLNKNEVDNFTSEFPYSCTSPVLSSEAYLKILVQNGGTEINVFEKIYPDALPDTEIIYEYAAANIVSTYLQKLPQEEHEDFKEWNKKMLLRKCPHKPVFFPQKRMFLSAKF